MTEPALKKTHELLEKLAAYVMEEAPTKQELKKRLDETKIEIKLEMEKRLQSTENILETKADKEDIQTILNGMDGIVKELDIIRTEQSAFISGIKRLENRVLGIGEKDRLKRK